MQSPDALTEQRAASPRSLAAPVPDNVRLAVIVASAGRPDDVAQLLGALDRQTRRPDLVVVAVPATADAPPIACAVATLVTVGPRGLPAQRNAGLRAAAPCDLAVFFDDDFLPADDYLAQVAEAMRQNPTLLAVDGCVVHDGAAGPGLAWGAAERLLAASSRLETDLRFDQKDGLYGCNMCYRAAALGPAPFDEALPLYAWLEDYDLSSRMARMGRIGRVMAARGVHLGVKRGRTSGLRLGYSQVANPLYLYRKGTMPLAVCARHLLRRPLGNLWGALQRDPHIDRAGRLRGNLLGLLDAVSGRIALDRVLRL